MQRPRFKSLTSTCRVSRAGPQVSFLFGLSSSVSLSLTSCQVHGSGKSGAVQMLRDSSSPGGRINKVKLFPTRGTRGNAHCPPPYDGWPSQFYSGTLHPFFVEVSVFTHDLITMISGSDDAWRVKEGLIENDSVCHFGLV